MQALVIDNNQADHAALVSHLHHSGYATVSVRSIADAQQALVEQPFDVLLLELRLPDSDGGRLCYEIRERLVYQLIIIFVSAHDTPLSRAATLQLGADDFMGKPYDVEELLTRIQMLQRRRMITMNTPATPCPMAYNVPVQGA